MIVAEFAIAIAVIIYAGFHDIPMVFFGAPAGLPLRFTTVCQSADAAEPCHAAIHELWRNRFRIATTAPTSRLTVSFEPGPMTVHQLLVSVAQPTVVRLRTAAGEGASTTDPVMLASESRRTVIPLPADGSATGVSFAPQVSSASSSMVVTELAFYADGRGLLSDDRPLFAAIPPLRYHATLVPRTVTTFCLFTLIAAFFVPPGWLKRMTPTVLAIACFSLCVIDLAVLYSPYTGRDLRSYYASGPLQEGPGSNLNGAIWEATRLLAGQGFTVADGLVSWAKMPGYGLFAALAGLLFGHATMLQLVMSTVFLQVIFFAAAVGFFAWAAGKLWRPPVVWTVGLLVAMVPKQLGYTQVDSVIAPVALVVLGILCLRLNRSENGRSIDLPLDAALHIAFALWFLMRPDVLPAWAVVSVILHFRQPRRLLMPILLAVLIGTAWAGYKMRYTGEFVPTTSTTGASLVCGLWEVPSRFPFVCSDESYFAWVTSHTPFDPKSAAGGNVVIREVLKFWLIFPGHFAFMIYNKMLRCFSGDLWPGIPTDLQMSIFQVTGRGSLIVVCLTAVALAVAAGYRRCRTLLLAWPILLNAPLFWIMQTSEGRYYGAVGVALLISAVPLLFDGDFYRALLLSRRTTVTVLTGVAIVAIGAWPLHDWLLHNDSFHYWTPFLDPSHSTWGTLK